MNKSEFDAISSAYASNSWVANPENTEGFGTPSACLIHASISSLLPIPSANPLLAAVDVEFFDWEAAFYLPAGAGRFPPSDDWKDPRNFEHLAGWISEDA